MDNTIRILIVEDDDVLAFILSRFLEMMGLLNVYRACTYIEALTLFQKDNPDVLLMDINLNEEKTGIDFVNEIRTFSNVPAIFLSSTLDESLIEQAKSIINSDFLAKPYDYDALKSLLFKMVIKV